MRFLFLAVALVVVVSGCADQSASHTSAGAPRAVAGSTNSAAAVQGAVLTSAVPSAPSDVSGPTSLSASKLSCDSFMADGTKLNDAVQKKYGEIDDCVSLGGA